ncbi:type III secretion inner membrane ring lipoprotein SctJ [Pseudomonas iridis]|nr:type III secretion inner membrane ring lipoprotein SctJ [Pseudomonas iridis]MCT8945778.1 type III secretion inner membrane ring lipoprotein SctJ [Pseudomonas iridis]
MSFLSTLFGNPLRPLLNSGCTRPIARLLLLTLICGLLQACKVELYTNLSEHEANTMVAALLHKGIAANRVVQKDGRSTVNVAEDRFAQAVSTLDEIGLPRPEFANLGQVFKSNGLVSSAVQERAQMIYALSEELAHTVSQIDGVLTARVHVVLPDNDLLKRNIAPASASVFVRYEAGLDINSLIPQIKTLVAKGISGLSYEGVSVIPVRAEKRVPSDSSAPVGSFLGMLMFESSLGLAYLLFGTLLLTIVGLVAALAWLLHRNRQPRAFVLDTAP